MMFKKDLKSPSLSEKGSIIKKLLAFICSVWLTMGTFAQVSQLKPKYPVGVSYSIPFDTVSNFKGQEQVLKIDVYAPIQKSEIKNRPTVLLLFGGGFYWGNKNNYPMETICNRLAQMGLVAISMDYRTRWKKSLSEEEKGATTLYRAVQDLSSAMSFIEQEIKTTNSWKIDTTNFFLGGNSSGAITVLNYYFVNPSNPNIFSNLEANLGSWYKTNYRPKALINLCGAISDTNLITDAIPILSAHGNEDNIVPYKTAQVDFKIPLITTFPKVTLQGSYWINERSKNLSGKSHLYTYQQQRHTPFDGIIEPKIYQGNMDKTINLISNFLNNQVYPNQEVDIEKDLHIEHTSQCGVDISENEWQFYPVDKSIKKIYLKVEDLSGKTLLRKKIKKKLKVFKYQPRLESGNYILKVGYSTFQKTIPVKIN